MKQGWEYKKLGEVCEIYQPRTLSTDMLTNTGNYPVYGANGIIGYYNQYNHKDQEVLLTCRGATCGTINISEPYSWINGNAMVIHRKSEEMLFKYLKYLMLSLDYSFIITGAAQPQITRQKLAPTKIGIPPKSTQLSIVSELDKINELIRLKKEQLKDYDNLAQSIFYEMFGDPVENEKGWEVKKLGEVCITITDGDHMPPPKSESGIPFLTISDINKETRELDFSNTYFVPIEYYNNLKEERKAKLNDLLYTVTGSYGIPVIVKDERQFCFQRHIALIRPQKEVLSTYFLCYWVLSAAVKSIADKVATGIAQKTVGLNSIRKFEIIIPPLPLQHLFAQRIEQIERQKSAVQKSITDLETLLASRMQYWFE